jgi:hypothetical protein
MGLLKQALECSKHADVRFELDDGSRLVGAHRASLCCASESFEGMFSSGMKEEEQGLVRMRGVDASAVKALLEFVYLGNSSPHTAPSSSSSRPQCRNRAAALSLWPWIFRFT